MSIKFPQHIADALIASGLAEAEAPVEVPVPAPASAARVTLPSVATVATPADSAFIRPGWYGRLQFGLLAPDQRGASLFGPRGSGKTTAVHYAAQEAGIELVTFQAAAGNTIDDLIGQRDLDNGRTIFTDGPLAEAIRKDCWLLIEEANMLHPGTLSKLNTLTDGSGDRLKLPSSEALSVGKRFRVILAFNEGSNYAGTREVNAALRDRLMPIYCDYFPADQETSMLVNRTSIDQSSATALVAMAGAIRAARDTLQVDLSPRALVRMIRLVQCLRESWADAFEHAMLDLVGDPMDRKPQRDAILQAALCAGLAEWEAPTFGVSTVETGVRDAE